VSKNNNQRIKNKVAKMNRLVIHFKKGYFINKSAILCLILVVYFFIDNRSYDVDCHRIVFIVWNDDVCVCFGWFDKLFMHRFQCGLISVQYFVHITTSVYHIAF